MSEYQYYEFQAIDRPLTAAEMRELREYSSRARITSTSFVNDYAWGSFKGNPDAWMERYFDAFLYLANWGTHEFKLRLSSRLLPLTVARDYCGGGRASVREADGKVILSFDSDDEGGGEWVEGQGHLAPLVPLRAELARGDVRALYLGWLLRAQSGDLDDEDVEPPVPPGLGQPSASLESLADFLRIDEDLLAVAALASQPLEEVSPRPEDVRAWVTRLPASDKDDFLSTLLLGTDASRIEELRQKFLRQRKPSNPPPETRRTVGELLRAAEAHSEDRLRREAEERSKEKARRERSAAAARAKYLDGIVGKEPKLWAEVETLIATKQPKSYDRAVELLADLRDLAARKKGSDFLLRVTALRQANERKPSFLERLRKVGL
ncbi:MAG: hypothetical protein HZB55_16805 [Deltaproteobacteria bacterium]|nr:hypothetical protein [Deltaproteobacteria bacterium]